MEKEVKMDKPEDTPKKLSGALFNPLERLFDRWKHVNTNRVTVARQMKRRRRGNR